MILVPVIECHKCSKPYVWRLHPDRTAVSDRFYPDPDCKCRPSNPRARMHHGAGLEPVAAHAYMAGT